MSTPNYKLVSAPLAGNEIRVVGDSAQIVLMSQTIKKATSGWETLETYGATNFSLACEFQSDCMADERCADCEIERRAPDITIRVRWCYNVADPSFVVDNTEESWELEIVEASRPLASHPYFANRYVAGGNVIMEKIIEADHALATGKPFDSSGPLQVFMQRYMGLRGAGVDDWNPVIIMLRKRVRYFRSQNPATWTAIFSDVNRSFRTQDLTGLPAQIKAALVGLKTVEYADDGSVDPSGASNTSFFWVKKPPQMQLSGRNARGPSDVTITYLGAQYVSAVLYPPGTGLGTCAAFKLWDPKSN